MDLRVLLLLVPGLLGWLAQRRVRGVFERYDAVPNRAGVTGDWVANRLLLEHDLPHVAVQRVPGTLSDHYDPTRGVLRLSAPVADGATVAALGVAAHEVGHAAQEAQGYRFNRARRRVAGAVGRLSPFAGVLLLGGFVLGIPPLAAAAGAFLVLMLLFAVVTLPVELDASRRAIEALRVTGIATAEELPGVRAVLRAAAFTYVAKLGWRLGILLFLVAGVVSAQRLA